MQLYRQDALGGGNVPSGTHEASVVHRVLDSSGGSVLRHFSSVHVVTEHFVAVHVHDDTVHVAQTAFVRGHRKQTVKILSVVLSAHHGGRGVGIVGVIRPGGVRKGGGSPAVTVRGGILPDRHLVNSVIKRKLVVFLFGFLHK